MSDIKEKVDLYLYCTCFLFRPSKTKTYYLGPFRKRLFHSKLYLELSIPSKMVCHLFISVRKVSFFSTILSPVTYTRPTYPTLIPLSFSLPNFLHVEKLILKT